MPLPAVNVPALVMPPRKVRGESPELFQVAPDAMVTKPGKIFVPVDEVMLRLPPAPAPTMVIPEILKSESAAEKDPLFPIDRLPLIIKFPDDPVKEPDETTRPLLNV